MPTLTATRPTVARRPAKTHPKAILATSSGIKLTFPFAPRQVEHGGWADEWATLARPGRRPLLLRAADGLPTLGFTVLLGYADHQTSVEHLLHQLRLIAWSGLPVYVSLGPSEEGSWVLTDVKVSTLLRRHLTNEITRCEVDLSFSAAISAAVKVGPLTAAKPKPKPPAKPKPKAKAPTGRWYTIKSGDTLGKIAARYLGDADDWRQIANASQNKGKLRTPSRLAVGLRIWVPG